MTEEVNKPASSPENALNKFCREYKDVLNVGSRVGVFLVLCLILVQVTKEAVMTQVEWAQKQCLCQDWGGDAFTLRTQMKQINSSLWIPGVTDGGNSTE